MIVIVRVIVLVIESNDWIINGDWESVRFSGIQLFPIRFSDYQPLSDYEYEYRPSYSLRTEYEYDWLELDFLIIIRERVPSLALAWD